MIISILEIITLCITCFGLGFGVAAMVAAILMR